MLAEFGCRHVIVGHSERRALHGETDALVAQKADAALAHGLVPIVCVGETLAERETGATQAVVARQLGAVLDRLGRRIDECGRRLRAGLGDRHRQDRVGGRSRRPCTQFLRSRLADAGAASDEGVRILYGGSVKADNAAELFAETRYRRRPGRRRVVEGERVHRDLPRGAMKRKNLGE